MGTGRGHRAAVLDQLAETDPERATELAELRHHDPQGYRKAMRRLGRQMGIDVPIRGPGSPGGRRRVGEGAGLDVEARPDAKAAEDARAVANVKAARTRKKKAEEPPPPEPVEAAEPVEEKAPKKRTKKKET